MKPFARDWKVNSISRRWRCEGVWHSSYISIINSWYAIKFNLEAKKATLTVHSSDSSPNTQYKNCVCNPNPSQQPSNLVRQFFYSFIPTFRKQIKHLSIFRVQWISNIKFYLVDLFGVRKILFFSFSYCIKNGDLLWNTMNFVMLLPGLRSVLGIIFWFQNNWLRVRDFPIK